MVTAVADEEFLSLIRFKLEALVELCHLSPALLLHGSIRACKLQMGFSWAFMQTRHHRSVCRKQTAKSWEARAKGSHFQTTSNTSSLNAISGLAPGCERWLKKPNQSQKQIGIIQTDVNERLAFNAYLLLFTLLCTTTSTYIIRYNQWTCSCKFEQRMDL